jgi:hypothetical protein
MAFGDLAFKWWIGAFQGLLQASPYGYKVKSEDYCTYVQ